MTTFVLVHGGWHGGWCWDSLATRLRVQGHTVYAPSLTGLADRAHLIDAVTGPETHVDDITSLITFHDLRDITLVGHSYGGIVITGVASQLTDRIAHLVYLDAFVPTRSGQAANQMANPERAAEMAALVAANQGNGISPNGFDRWASDPATQDWLRAKCTPHPKSCFGKGVTLYGDPFAVPRKTFVLAAQHNPSPFHQFYTRTKTAPDWQTHSLNCLHDIMIEQPETLAGILTA